MVTLTTEERRALWQEWMTANREAVSIAKADLRAAVDAVDEWIEANMASFNAAIPQPARGALSAKQKALLLAFVLRRRFEVS